MERIAGLDGCMYDVQMIRLLLTYNCRGGRVTFWVGAQWLIRSFGIA